MKILAPIRIGAGELRPGDVYVTRGNGIAVKRYVIGRRETIAGDAKGDHKELAREPGVRG